MMSDVYINEGNYQKLKNLSANYHEKPAILLAKLLQ